MREIFETDEFLYEIETALTLDYNGEERELEPLTPYKNAGVRIVLYKPFAYNQAGHQEGGDKDDVISLTLPSEINGLPVTSIAEKAFAFADNLGEIVLPDSLIAIEKGAFFFCKNLDDIVIPENTEYIGDICFFCSGLKSAVLSDKISVIPDECFAYCRNLKEVKLSKNIKV